MEFLNVIIDAWNLIIIQPMINGLVLLYSWSFLNFGIAIIAFTLLVRLALVPLTVKQSRQIKAMSALQPLMKDIQSATRATGRKPLRRPCGSTKSMASNPSRLSRPDVHTVPDMDRALPGYHQTVPSNPESLVGLSRHLYVWLPSVHSVIPINSNFLWMDLALPDPLLS